MSAVPRPRHGGTGMLGHAAVRLLPADSDLTASVRDPDAAQRHGLPAALVGFDARQDDVGELLNLTRPGAVLNTIGLVNQLPEGQSLESAVRLNALLPHQIAEACARRRIPTGPRQHRLRLLRRSA